MQAKRAKDNLNQDALVQGLVRQYPGALSELCDRYCAALFGIVLPIVQSQELAEQFIQDIFMKVWKRCNDYDAGKGRLFTWLLIIARNTAIDATRTAYFQHYKKTDSPCLLVYMPGSDLSNTDHIGLRDIVTGLDGKYRDLIDLVYFKGYTQEEAAEELGVPLGTVKTRLRHAIGALRQVFGANHT